MSSWTVDTRRLTFSLPEDTNSTWFSSLEQITHNIQCTMYELDTLVGRLNHAAIAIPMARHFLFRVSRLINRTWRKNHIIYLSDGMTDDLTLWSQFISKAHSGISINLLVERHPNHMYIADSCENGIGSYS